MAIEIADLPIKHGDFPVRYVCLPEGNSRYSINIHWSEIHYKKGTNTSPVPWSAQRPFAKQKGGKTAAFCRNVGLNKPLPALQSRWNPKQPKIALVSACVWNWNL